MQNSCEMIEYYERRIKEEDEQIRLSGDMYKMCKEDKNEDFKCVLFLQKMEQSKREKLRCEKQYDHNKKFCYMYTRYKERNIE